MPELVARAIHEKSVRNAGPFVPVKCAALSEDVLEAELFGIEAGALLGTNQARLGRCEVAAGGTLFLDEVSKLSPKMQFKLAKVLQEGMFEPVGGERVLKIQFRLICSTSLNIDQAVRDGQFREDLYYRLANCAVYIPPVSERQEDIPALIEYFIGKFNQTKSKNIYGISPDAMSALIQHTWPNNVREIENLIERIVVLKTSGSIEVCDLPPRLRNLVTDNIDSFYEKASLKARTPTPTPTLAATSVNRTSSVQGNNNTSFRPGGMNNQNSQASHFSSSGKGPSAAFGANFPSGNSAFSQNHSGGAFDELGEIEQFVKKEIDLGSGIDFYRVVEEFENRLIAEALRRTNHNKNRAAQLLSMNRTTLVEKLKKRAASSPVKIETGRVKRNPAFTIFDGLGNEAEEYDASLDFLAKKSNDGFLDHD